MTIRCGLSSTSCPGGGSRSFFFFSSRRRHTRSLCDWSSDVCSSDLAGATDYHLGRGQSLPGRDGRPGPEAPALPDHANEIGRASCRERVEISVGAVSLTKKTEYKEAVNRRLNGRSYDMNKADAVTSR